MPGNAHHEFCERVGLALPVFLNVVCYCYTRPDLDDAALRDLNRQIVVELLERAIAVPSIVSLKARNYLHVTVTNHRSRRDDIDLLVREVARI